MTPSVHLSTPDPLTLLPAEEENAVTRFSIASEVPSAASSMAGRVEVSYGEAYRILQEGALQERAVTLSAAQARALLRLIDDLIQRDVEAFLQRMEDPALDEADERDFVNVSSAQFWADDDPADSVYDDL